MQTQRLIQSKTHFLLKFGPGNLDFKNLEFFCLDPNHNHRIRKIQNTNTVTIQIMAKNTTGAKMVRALFCIWPDLCTV